MAVSKDWTFQRRVLAKTYNPIVKEYFGDLSPSEENFDTGRKTLLQACLIKPKDGQQIALHKMNFFYYVVLEIHTKPDIYGVPITQFKENYSYYPQVMCWWKERDDIAKANNRRPITAYCAIRYTGDLSSKADITALANKIKTTFDNPQHHWTKGRLCATYWDKKNQIEMMCYPSSQADAENLFKAMLSIRNGVTWKDDYMAIQQFPAKDWTPTDTEMIGGKSLKLPRQRLSGEVYFTHAELKHHRLKEDILLYAATAQRRRQSFI